MYGDFQLPKTFDHSAYIYIYIYIYMYIYIYIYVYIYIYDRFSMVHLANTISYHTEGKSSPLVVNPFPSYSYLPLKLVLLCVFLPDFTLVYSIILTKHSKECVSI